MGLGLVVALAMHFGTGDRPGPRVLAESEGRIQAVAIHYTRSAAELTWPTLRAFFGSLEPDVRIVAVCGDETDEHAFRVAAAQLRQKEIETVVVGAAITGWSKDRYLVADRNLVCPKETPSALSGRTNDALVARALERKWPGRYRAVPSDLVFDAGDILCTGTRAWVNDELPHKNPGIEDWLGRVQAMTGRTPLWLKGSPGHHIGMFAAPLQGLAVVVADPDLGKRLWTPEASERLGQPDESEEATAPFRKAIADLVAAGFEVVRTPAAVIAPRVYVTYTNGVFEQRDGRRIVYLPSYGVPVLDQAGAEAYRSQGWEVRPIPVDKVFRLCGTIGCLVNVLERGQGKGP